MTNYQIESAATHHASKYPEHLRTDIVLHYGLGIVRGLKELKEELAAKDKQIEKRDREIREMIDDIQKIQSLARLRELYS